MRATKSGELELRRLGFYSRAKGLASPKWQLRKVFGKCDFRLLRKVALECSSVELGRKTARSRILVGPASVHVKSSFPAQEKSRLSIFWHEGRKLLKVAIGGRSFEG